MDGGGSAAAANSQVAAASSSAASGSGSVHVLKFNAPGVWSNVVVPTPDSGKPLGKVRASALRVTVDGLTSDLCLGLLATGVEPMNCQPGNPIAFLTLMWNVSHNRVYFLNHPLVPLGSAGGAGKAVAITYHEHAPPAPGTVYTIAVDARCAAVRGLCGESLCFEILPVSRPMLAGLGGTLRFGLALSGDNDRVHLDATFPLEASAVTGKPDTLVIAASATDAKPPASAKRRSFDAVAVTVESVLPGFRVQERYKGAAERRQHIEVNEAYPGLKKIHRDPDIYEIDGFLTPEECRLLMERGAPHLTRSAVVGQTEDKTKHVTPSSGRTSETCYVHRHHLPWLMEKTMTLIPGKPVKHFELPQIARYLKTQKYDRHQDAFNLLTDSGRQSCANGGQRVGTLLIYLNDVSKGGNTAFVNMGVKCAPRQGKAVVFFPCFADGIMDTRMLHAAEPAEDTKWVSQIWIRQANFEGTTGRPETSSDDDSEEEEAASGGGGGVAAAAAAAE